jgi:hypothetical protein
VKTHGQKQSQAHEKRLEKVLGGSRTAASGAFWSRKGDVRSERFLAEHKYTAAKSFSLKSADLKKVETEALLVGRTPIFCVSLDGRDYVVLLEDDFVAISGLDKTADTPS